MSMHVYIFTVPLRRYYYCHTQHFRSTINNNQDIVYCIHVHGHCSSRNEKIIDIYTMFGADLNHNGLIKENERKWASCIRWVFLSFLVIIAVKTASGFTRISNLDQLH